MDALTNTGLQIHVDAIKKEYPEWQQKYLDTQEYQKDALKNDTKRFKRDRNYKDLYDKETGLKVECVDVVPNPYLKQVKETLMGTGRAK